MYDCGRAFTKRRRCVASSLVRFLLMAVFIPSISTSSDQGDLSNAPDASPTQDSTAASAGKKPRPNVLIILADDLGTGDIPGYWSQAYSKVKMPNLQTMMSEGVTFMDAHSTPVCAPSRYMLLSGNYPQRGNLPGGTWFPQGFQFRKDQKSLAHVLRNSDANYHTFMTGKWHQRYRPVDIMALGTRFLPTHKMIGASH